MSADKQILLESAARAEDLFDLLEHIAWTDTVKPELLVIRDQHSQALVNHLLGTPLPEGVTKEQIAGKIFGINFIVSKLESILSRGKKAVETLSSQGISLT
jgi:hypothetical protein